MLNSFLKLREATYQTNNTLTGEVIDRKDTFHLKFRALNAGDAPNEHSGVTISMEVE